MLATRVCESVKAAEARVMACAAESETLAVESGTLAVAMVVRSCLTHQRRTSDAVARATR